MSQNIIVVKTGTTIGIAFMVTMEAEAMNTRNFLSRHQMERPSIVVDSICILDGRPTDVLLFGRMLDEVTRDIREVMITTN